MSKTTIDPRAIPAPDRLREARTKILKDTDHHSYGGRSEFIQGLIDKSVLDPLAILAGAWQIKVNRGFTSPKSGQRWIPEGLIPILEKHPVKEADRVNYETIMRGVFDATRAKYPWHSSPAHVKLTVLRYLAQKVRASQKESK